VTRRAARGRRCISGGLLDHDYLAARTTGLDAVTRSVTAWWPERVEVVTGVPASLLRETARLLAPRPRRTAVAAPTC